MTNDDDHCPCGSGKLFGDCHLSDPRFAITLGLLEKLRELGTACVRPILFTSDVPGVPLWRRGTGFIVKAVEAIWVVTAWHVVKGRHRDEVFVARQPPADGASLGERFNVLKVVQTHPDDGDDTSGFDIALMLTDQARHPDALDLDEIGVVDLSSLPVGQLVQVFGFPSRLKNDIDYETGAIGAELYCADGTYDGPSASLYEHKIALFTPGTVTDGMSGSPVLTIVGSDAVLIGITVRGGSGTVARFVDGAWLPALTTRLHAQMLVASNLGTGDIEATLGDVTSTVSLKE